MPTCAVRYLIYMRSNSTVIPLEIGIGCPMLISLHVATTPKLVIYYMNQCIITIGRLRGQFLLAKGDVAQTRWLRARIGR